ncbi:MAG TPA: hypothetical protein VK666_12190, partial [Chryseolinea sp.]|nr:hypothetical protein [Chryseolinea sp.]
VVFNPNGKKVVEPAKAPEREITLDENWSISYPGQDTIYKTAARADFSREKTINEDKLKPGYDDREWRSNSFILGKKSPTGNTRYLQEAIKKEDAPDNYIYWRTNIPPGSRTMLFSPNMNGTDVWIDGKKFVLANNSIELPANARLLAFARLIDKEQLPTFPMAFVVTGKDNCPLESWYAYGLEQYTGYIDYERVINTRETGSAITLDLGSVKFMAEIFVNDKSVGARLWPPYKFDISRELKQGENKIRVRVGNLSVSSMRIQDDMGKLRGWGWRDIPDFEQCDAGLFGPVKLIVTK